MFPEIDLNLIKDEIEYIENQIEMSSRGVVPLFDFKSGEFVSDSRGRIKMLSGRSAIEMWIRKILSTYINRYEIYYDDLDYREYGVDLKQNFFSKKLPEILVLGELEREIREALLGHRLIKAIDNFDISSQGHTLFVKFDVVLEDEMGLIEVEEEVRIPSEK